MPLAMFDLDNTLIGGDSDYLWGEFLCEEGIIEDPNSFQKMNEHFYQQYEIGKLDIYAWAEFSFKVLSDYPIDELNDLRENFIQQKIEPIFLEKAQSCINKHKTNESLILWWSSNDVQLARNSFCEKYAKTNSNEIKYWSELLN